MTPTLDAGGNSTIEGIHGKASTEKYGLGVGDIVFLEGGRADGLSPGELLSAVLPSDKIFHPEDRRLLGRLYKYLGRIRVLSAQDETSIAEIVQLCTPITVGTKLKIFEPEPVPLRKLTPIRPVNFPVADEDLEGAPVIVIAWDKLLTLGAGYLVYIDPGRHLPHLSPRSARIPADRARRVGGPFGLRGDGLGTHSPVAVHYLRRRRLEPQVARSAGFGSSTSII